MAVLYTRFEFLSRTFFEFLPLFILPDFVDAIANLTREHEFVIEEVLEDYLLINAVVHTREVPFLKFVGVENISIEARVTTIVIGEMKDDSDRSRIFLRTFATVTDYVYFHIIHCFVPFLVGVTTVYQRFEFLSSSFL
jgi:hypothetical protein